MRTVIVGDAWGMSLTCQACVTEEVRRPFRVLTTTNKQHAALREVALHVRLKHAASPSRQRVAPLAQVA